MSKDIIGYTGVCPICGSQDGMIIKCADNKYRNMCRVISCPAMYHPTPFIGFDTQKDCENPFDSELLQNEITVYRYIYGKEKE